MTKNRFHRMAPFGPQIRRIGVVLMGCLAMLLPPPQAMAVPPDPLTVEERAWLNAHADTIRLAPAPYWEPMEFFDESGTYQGLVADYMKLIERRLGFTFVIVRGATWAEVLELAQQQRIDVISAAYDTPERRAYMRWTKPYLEVPEVIVTRKSLTRDLSMEDLEGMRVGVTQAYVVADWIRTHYPQLSLTLVPNDLVGLRMVSFGELDVMIAEFPIASYAIEKEKITNLRVAGQTGYSAKLSIGVRRDWPILAQIMSKGLNLVTDAERDQIYRRWINLENYPFYFQKRFWYAIVGIMLGAILVAVLVFAWNLTLRRKVRGKTLALTQELTARKQVEEALRESENRLTTLIANLPGMAYRHHIEPDERWPMDYISNGCLELTGYPDISGPGRETAYFDTVVHPEDRAHIRSIIKAALARHEPFRLTYRILTADGTVKWVWEQGVGIYSDVGEVLQVEGFVTDITVFKRAEEALYRSRKRFQDLVVNSLIGISIVQEGRIVYQNPEQERLFGPLPTDFNLFEAANIHPEDREKVTTFLRTSDSDRSGTREPDFRVYPYTAQGQLGAKFRWVHARISRIEYQERSALLLNMMDVTRTRELEHTVSVQDKMASLGKVAAGIAHEIRNPLSGINLHLGVAEKKLRRSADLSAIADSLGEIREASHSIETVIQRVMGFVKPGLPKFRPIDINLPVNEAIGLSAVTMRKNGIGLSVTLAATPLKCKADGNLVQRIVLNLLTNAAEALQHSTTERAITVTTAKRGGDACIRVTDSGPGVPAAIADRIFEFFYTTKSDGTGIGLSLSRRIAKDHFGSLELESAPSSGAAFVLRLPLLKEPA